MIPPLHETDIRWLCIAIRLSVETQVACFAFMGCRVAHDSVLADFASLMVGANIAGEVNVGIGCYIGAGACVINRVSLGEWSVIGAGAVVVRDIPPKVVAVGVPAKPIKTLAD